MPTRKKTSHPKPTSQPATGPQPFETQDSHQAYDHFLPLVEKIAEADVQVSHGDVEVMRVNIATSMKAIKPHLDTVAKRRPHTNPAEILELPALGLALMYAESRVHPRASDHEIKQKLEQLRPLREWALSQLEILAHLGHVSADRVAAIRTGTGPLDAARDGVAIAGVFKEEKAALAGKHPFTDELLTRLGDLGNWLIGQLRPKHAPKEPTRRDPENLLRDRFYSEVVRRYDELRECGVAVFGLRELDQHIPPLQSRVRSAAPAVTPPATPPTPKTAQG